MSEQDTLGDALPREMARVRDEVMPAYIAIGPPGQFALHMMRMDLVTAAVAIADGDIAKMIICYNSLKGYST